MGKLLVAFAVAGVCTCFCGCEKEDPELKADAENAAEFEKMEPHEKDLGDFKFGEECFTGAVKKVQKAETK